MQLRSYQTAFLFGVVRRVRVGRNSVVSFVGNLRVVVMVGPAIIHVRYRTHRTRIQSQNVNTE